MPSFSFSSIIRAASQERALRLKITHNLVYGSPSDPVHNVKGRVPKELDILWLSDVTISLSGSLDAHQIPAQDIARSGLAHHLHMLLKTNADRVGLNNVSRPFVDDVDGLSKLTLTPSRPLPRPSRPHADLASLHLAYIWTSIAKRSNTDSSGRLFEEAGPFSETLFLPAEALLNRVGEQFLIYHLVGRYPLIFGPWCKKLDLEMQYFPSIGNSIVEIMMRSENSGFLSKCKRLLKAARSQHKSVLQASSAALSTWTDSGAVALWKDEIDLPTTSVLTDEEVLCESLEQLFRVRVPQNRFRPAVTPQFVSLPQDDNDGLLESTPDDKIEDEALWIELSEITTSPCTTPAEDYRAPPEDAGMFAKGGWLEGGMRRSPVDAMFAPLGPMCRARSDESLIDAPISLANITTRSPPASTFTLYHHQDVDCWELDSATSGLGDSGSQIAHLEGPGTSTLSPNPTHSPLYAPHDRCFSNEHEQLTQDCRAYFESIETDVAEDSDSVLLELDTDGGQATDGTDVDLDWLV